MVAGAGARGAYEAGAMAKLLPRILDTGLSSVVLLGTSSGAINVALWASRATAKKGMLTIAREVEDVWRAIEREDVFTIRVKPYAGLIGGGFVDLLHGAQRALSSALTGTVDRLLSPLKASPRLPFDATFQAVSGSLDHLADSAFDVVGAPVAHPFSSTGALLDTHPLWQTARKYVDFDALNRNVHEGRVGGIGVVATSCPSDGSGGRSRVFINLGRNHLPSPEAGGALDYVSTDLSAEHVLASAAIPVAFPAVHVSEPAGYAGYYIDGGVRLNAPIEPAIKLGATRVIVVSSHATDYPVTRASTAASTRPDVLDVAAQSIHAVLADGMIEDLRALARINKLVRDNPDVPLQSPSGRPYRSVELVKVSPPNGTLSPLAAEVAKGIRDPLGSTLLQFAGRIGGGGGRNELLSYLLFEPAFAEAQLQLGAHHAGHDFHNEGLPQRALPARSERNDAGFRLEHLLQQDPGIRPALDARLQVAIARRRTGMLRGPTTSVGADEIAIVARVSDVEKWEARSEVRVGVTIGRTLIASDSTRADYLVTARVPIGRVERLRELPFVQSLKASQPLWPVLAATVRETRSDVGSLGAYASEGGKGVLIGIVDFGLDFAHENFLDADGRSRVELIWNQSAGGAASEGVDYGRLFTRPDIDAALQQPDPYAALGYGPASDDWQTAGTHGTHVADIAAGSGRGSGVAGCAPDATIMFVDLSSDDLAWEGPSTVETSFGDSVRLLEAIAFLFERAGDRPCVVNVSLGTNGGPHDGSTPVEQGIDALVRAAPNRAVVIAASNSHEDGIHASGRISRTDKAVLEWRLPFDHRPAEMEIWLPANARTTLELIASDGTSLGTVGPGSNHQIVGDDGSVLVYVANRLHEPNNGDNVIAIFLAGAFPRGTWRVVLHEQSSEALEFHAWIERFDNAQSSFVPPHDNRFTLGSISCGFETIVVGSYDAHKSSTPISYFSSEGPTRDGRQKPELSAPGHDVLAAWSRTQRQATRKSGTSMAAPAVTGIIALVFADAVSRGQAISSASLRELLRGSARVTPVQGHHSDWDSRYGAGRVDAQGAVLVART
ncbi:MAG TPA: S8 family serine peptidase [Polyangiales bacterium]|nr:S8 family serine peptidase [Polyangiales bacterium]